MNKPFNPKDYLLYCEACGEVGLSLPYKKWTTGPHDHIDKILGTHRGCKNPMSGGHNMAHVCYLKFDKSHGYGVFPHAISAPQFRALSREEQQRTIELIKEDIRKSWEPDLIDDHFMYCSQCFKIAEKLPFDYDRVARKLTHSVSDCCCDYGCVFFIEPGYMPHGMLISEYNALPESEKADAMALMKQDVIDEYNSPLNTWSREFGKQIAAKTAGYTAAFKCPNCGSYHSDRISPVSQLASLAVFGIFSKRINQDYVCRDCGYKW